GRVARCAAGADRLDPGERGAPAAAGDRRAARRAVPPLRRARWDVPGGQAAARSGLPGVRRPPDDHRVHRLRGLLRVTGRVAGRARASRRRTGAALGRYPQRMRRCLALIAALAIALVACTPAATTGGTPSPAKTGDFKQAKLDIAYSFMSDASVHKPTAKQLLTGALNGMKKEAKSSGGSDDVATPDFTSDTETNLADFKKFAAAAGALALKNPQLSADRLAQAGVVGMMQADPDCHTYYLDGKGGVINSRNETPKNAAPVVPSGGTFIQQQPDQSGLQ